MKLAQLRSFVATTVMAVLASASVYAACPAAPVGSTADPTIQMLSSSGGGFGPTTSVDATREGSIVYDSTTNLIKYCDGTSWITLTTGTPSLTGAGAANHIAYWSGASGLTYDSNQLYWDATNNRLGIGTSAPGSPLTVRGTGVVNTSGTLAAYEFYDRSVGTGLSVLYRDANRTRIWDSTAGDRMIIDNSNGNVGIGNATPSGKLHVLSTGDNVIYSQGGSVIGQLGAASVAGQANTGTYSNHPFAIITGNVERMRIDTAGDVGIGTTDPTTKLNVIGTVSATKVVGSWQATSGSVVFSGSLTASTWTDIDLSSVTGARTSLVMLRVRGTACGTCAYELRPKGEPYGVGYDGGATSQGGGSSATQHLAGRVSYVTLDTNASGVVQIRSYATMNTEIAIRGYIN